MSPSELSLKLSRLANSGIFGAQAPTMKPFIRKSSDTPTLSRVMKVREPEEAFEGARLSMGKFLFDRREHI
jgi:hypothetical protein